MKLNASPVSVCVGSTVFISIYQELLSATAYQVGIPFFDVEREYGTVARTDVEVSPGW